DGGCCGRAVRPVLRGGVHRGGGGDDRAQVRGVPVDGVRRVVLGRCGVGGQPGGGGHGAVGVNARGQAAGRGARLRSQQGRVLLQRPGERARANSGRLDRRDGGAPVVRARAVAERRGWAHRHARRGGDQRRGRARHPARRPPPALHNPRSRRQAPAHGRLDFGGRGARHRARRAHGLARPRSPDRPARRRKHRLDRCEAPARHRPGLAGPGAAGRGSGQDRQDPPPLRGEGHPLPRRPHPLCRPAPLHLHARARAGRLDGQAGPRPRRGDRGRHRPATPPEHLLRSRGALRGPRLLRRPGPRPRALRRGAGDAKRGTDRV
ncbi:MAG: Cobalt-zinc-cadmium resistance protein, partial [uncultured Rubrobacteraceae bacterium]